MFAMNLLEAEHRMLLFRRTTLIRPGGEMFQLTGAGLGGGGLGGLGGGGSGGGGAGEGGGGGG